eukprot:Pgem_evm1s14786
MSNLNKDSKWELLYHTSGGMRSEYIKIMFEDAGVDYEIHNRDMYAMTEAFSDGVDFGRGAPIFAPPILKNGDDFVLTQTPAIVEFVGEKLGYTPSTIEEKALCKSYLLSALDFQSDGRDPFHALKNKKSYYEQDKEPIVIEAIEEFKKPKGRMNKWLNYFEKLLKYSQDNKKDNNNNNNNDKPSSSSSSYIFGDYITYADFAIYQVLHNCSLQFPSEYNQLAGPLCKAFTSIVESRPNMQKYINSNDNYSGRCDGNSMFSSNKKS